MTLPVELLDLLGRPSTCYLATTMPDGSPQLTQTWVDTDGTNVVINSVLTHQKVKNVQRRPRVAVTISDPAHPSRYFEVRGRVTDVTSELSLRAESSTSRSCRSATPDGLTPGGVAATRCA